MKRREFITLLGGAIAAWPLAAAAQQGERMRRIGVLIGSATDADDTDVRARLAAFEQGLQQLGWIDGRNVRIEYRRGAGDADRIRRFAAELVALAPDVILASGTSTAGELQRATRSVPIVLVNVADPVGAGFVESLARPGGNITGFLNYEYGLASKWLEHRIVRKPRKPQTPPECAPIPGAAFAQQQADPLLGRTMAAVLCRSR
jgi:ABC-type uncharacterized transport system substrate-binding protein